VYSYDKIPAMAYGLFVVWNIKLMLP